MNRPYHHGDLRAALVEAALGMLESRGLQELSLRSLAAAAGVSRAAPYAHFADKRALLAAIAETGFERLASAMSEGLGAAGDAEARFLEIGRAYVGFALAHPSLFKLMFSAELGAIQEFPELQRKSERSYEIFKIGLDQFLRTSGVGGLDETNLRITAWSCVHGLAMLLLENRLSISPERRARLADDVTRTFAQMLVSG